jgi:peptidyl-prolyl cis-trans isomerase B (cyclophilin B)
MRRLALVTVIAGLLAMSPSTAGDKKNPVVVIDTSKGKITVELFEDKAPITVKNFLRYVDEKHYDNTIFHRVIADFMIQGGGFDANFKEKETYKGIKNEAGNGLSNKRGSIAMARTNDPDSATAQFFINSTDNPGLDRTAGKAGYAVFGQVTDKEGLETLDTIRGVQTGNKGGHMDVPVDNVLIRSVRRVEKK